MQKFAAVVVAMLVVIGSGANESLHLLDLLHREVIQHLR